MTNWARPCPGRVAAAALLAAMGSSGCGDPGPKVYPIEGAVTYMGRPVKSGTIRFEPAGPAMDPRATPEIRITDGRYKTSSTQGVLGGRYTVYILAGDGNSTPAPDGTVQPYGNVLFPPYYVIQVDLPAQGGTFDFPIPQQKGKRR